MSSLVLTGDTSGQVTLAAPAVAGTTTLTLPATTGTVLNDATVGVCRAWCNFNGTLTTPITPRASFNVSSVTKNGTGDYTVNFSTAISDANYSWNINSDRSTAPISQINSSTATPTTTTLRLFTYNTSLVVQDSAYVTVAIFR